MPTHLELDRLHAATVRAQEALQRAIDAHARGDLEAYRAALSLHDALLREARALRCQMSEPPVE